MYLYFECKVFLHVFDNHDQVGQLDAQRLPRVSRTSDVSSAHIGPHNFQDEALNIWIGDPLDMSISHFFVPNLQWFASYGVQDGQET